MRPGDIKLRMQLEERLLTFNEIHTLRGISSKAKRSTFIEQLIDSIRRVKYVTTIRERNISVACSEPGSIAFDPLKAAVYYMKVGNLDEAFWLVFLATHFGKNRRTKWQLVKEIYGNLEGEANWSWDRTRGNLEAFRFWLAENVDDFTGKFGNHRKYESLHNDFTGEAISSYINWIGLDNTHQQMIDSNIQRVGYEPRDLFDALYRNMNVYRFGRTAKFDYLTMVGKLGLVLIEPNSVYMHGATGPLSGAKLLFGNDFNAKYSQGTLDELLRELEKHLGLYFGMQILEDALCNWQKSPSKYVHFAG